MSTTATRTAADILGDYFEAKENARATAFNAGNHQRFMIATAEAYDLLDHANGKPIFHRGHVFRLLGNGVVECVPCLAAADLDAKGGESA